MISVTDFGLDANKFVLCRICPYGHDYQNTGLSLRYVKRINQCVECKRISDKENYSKNKSKRAEYGKKKFQENKNNPHYIQKRKQYREKNKEKLAKEKAKWAKNNKEATRLANKKSSKKHRDKKRLNLIKYRAKKRSVHVSYTFAQVIERQERFFSCCAYCGKTFNDKPKSYMHIDHFIPINKGGFDCIDNLVTACMYCNPSKSDNIPHEWYERQLFYSEERWKRILNVLGLTQDRYDLLVEMMKSNNFKPFSAYDNTTPSTLPQTT